MRHKNKALCQEIHFRNRFLERCNTDLNKQDYKVLCSHVRNGKPSYSDGTQIKTLDKQSNRLVVKSLLAPWLINEELIVIWDKKRNRLVTVLDKDLVATAEDIVWEKYYDQVDMIEFED